MLGPLGWEREAKTSKENGCRVLLGDVLCANKNTVVQHACVNVVRSRMIGKVNWV